MTQSGLLPALPVEAIEMRPKAGSRLLIPIVAVLGIGGGILCYQFLWQGRQSETTATAVTTDTKVSGGPVRPTVEILPSASATNRGVSTQHNPTGTSRDGETTRPHETAASADESGPKKKHLPTTEKRAIIRGHEQTDASTERRPLPHQDKTSTKKIKAFRPNPF
jgi:hypothetical protein